MDLRSVLNASDPGDRERAHERDRGGAPGSKAPPTPQRKHHQQPHPIMSPGAQYNYRDYPHGPPQPSPGGAMPINAEYPQSHTHAPPQPPPSQQLANSYPPPPSPYQAPGPYPGRPTPPTLQTNASFHDVRSPSAGSMPAPPQYRQPGTPSMTPSMTPTAVPGGATGYPFPPTQAAPEVASPNMRHQYPPPQHYPPQQQHIHHQQQPPQSQRRDSYSQGAGAPAHGPAPYVQQHAVPQTPPVGTPGAPNYPYVQQRSQSAQSTPTPTSAHSQHQYGQPYAQGSPVATTHRPSAEYNRPPSQPPTPSGAPLPPGARPSPGTGGFAQPPSPYQQRLPSAAGAPMVQPKASQVSPRPTPPSLPTQRMSSAHAYESLTPEFQKRLLPHQEREHSLSVSPKTRVPSLPANSDRPSMSASELDPRASQPMAVDSERAVTPAKRKLEDRDLSPRELEQKGTRPPPPGTRVNGYYKETQEQPEPATAPRKTRRNYPQPPIWAQSVHSMGSKIPKHANFVLQKRIASHTNGKRDGSVRSERNSRHATPESKAQQAVQEQAASAAPSATPTVPQDILGPWEASITGVKPYEEISKAVADFLFINVINHEDVQEIMSRGIAFEIEAKLGTLIDKDTNMRFEKRIGSECILQDTGRVAFRSSMTEVHHKAFNDFLNQIVIETDPRNPAGGGRVQVHYKHRREIDRFFELTPDLLGRLPGCMRARLGSRPKSVRVRVTYDQKTGEILSKIVKARVADFDLHIPTCPMDCRISVNLEMDWEGPVEELEQLPTNQGERQPDRNKDRLSYSQGHYQIDLTQVTQSLTGPGNSQRQEKEHELEIELASGTVIEQGRQAMSGAPHRYQELVEGLVDNVRVLARKAREFIA